MEEGWALYLPAADMAVARACPLHRGTNQITLMAEKIRDR